MKRYSTRGPVFEEDGGVFVLASEYDDDHALLEEAKGILEKIYDKRFSVVAFLDYNEIKDFLARAKEIMK